MIYSTEQLHVRNKRNLTNQERLNIVAKLLTRSNNGNLRRGDVVAVALEYGCDRSTIHRIWKTRKLSITNENLMGTVDSKIKSNSGRKGYNIDELLQRLKQLPLNKRTTERHISRHLGISRTVFRRLLSSEKIRRHGSRLRPALLEKNRMERIKFVLSWLNEAKTHFQSMYNVVHVDEKWFNQDKDKKTFYLAHDEPDPHRETRHKSHIPKIMFLAAVARPRYCEFLYFYFSFKTNIR